MGHIVPSISFVKKFRQALERGLSVQVSLEEVIRQERTTFSHQVYLWHCYWKSGNASEIQFSSHYESSFIQLIGAGLAGSPIYEHLENLEDEMEIEFERLWKAHLEALPVKLSIPLLLLFFPAYVILLFGPLLSQFMEGVQ